MELTPLFKIEAKGEDITKMIQKNLISLEVKDEDGTQSDELTLSISSVYKRPVFGDILKVWLGYKETRLTFVGSFAVQNSTITNKNAMRIVATGVDFGSGLKVKKTREFRDTTIKQIVQKIAGEYALSYSCDVDIVIGYIAQHGSSDLAFLENLSKKYHCSFGIKNNTLVFVSKKMEKLTYVVEFKEMIDLSVTVSNKTAYKSAKVTYRDTKSNQDKEVVCGSGEPVLNMEVVAKSEEDAKAQGEARLKKTGSATINGNLSIPYRAVFAGGIVRLKGTYDDGDYGIVSVSHTLDSSGFTTNIEFEN